MNKLISIIFLMFLLAIGVSCQKEGSSDSSKTHEGHKHSKTKVYYTCSMHPQIKEKKMGKCPICHMNLTKIEIDDEEDIQAAAIVPEKDIWQCKDFPDVTSETEDVCPMDGTPMVKKPRENKAAKVVAKVKLRKSSIEAFRARLFSCNDDEND